LVKVKVNTTSLSPVCSCIFTLPRSQTQVYLCLSIFIAVALFVFVAGTGAFQESPPFGCKWAVDCVFYSLLLLLCCHFCCRDIVSERCVWSLLRVHRIWIWIRCTGSQAFRNRKGFATFQPNVLCVIITVFQF